VSSLTLLNHRLMAIIPSGWPLAKTPHRLSRTHLTHNEEPEAFPVINLGSSEAIPRSSIHALNPSNPEGSQQKTAEICANRTTAIIARTHALRAEKNSVGWPKIVAEINVDSC
jgi:hypothetical protein